MTEDVCSPGCLQRPGLAGARAQNPAVCGHGDVYSCREDGVTVLEAENGVARVPSGEPRSERSGTALGPRSGRRGGWERRRPPAPPSGCASTPCLLAENSSKRGLQETRSGDSRLCLKGDSHLLPFQYTEWEKPEWARASPLGCLWDWGAWESLWRTLGRGDPQRTFLPRWVGVSVVEDYQPMSLSSKYLLLYLLVPYIDTENTAATTKPTRFIGFQGWQGTDFMCTMGTKRRRPLCVHTCLSIHT